jgi:hypothetical protein
MRKNKTQKANENNRPLIDDRLSDACASNCVELALTPAEAIILLRCLSYGRVAISPQEHSNGAGEDIKQVCNNVTNAIIHSLANRAVLGQ